MSDTEFPSPPLDREVKRRLAIIRHVEEVTGNVALTCRYYGISRQAYYTWYRRYQADGVDGLRTGSRRPKTCPHATHVEVVGKIIYLRQNYHFGPAKIAMYLKRYHDVAVSHSGVWRILKRLDLNRLPTSQRYKRHDKRWTRYEKQLPGHRVQIDVKFIERADHRPGRLAAVRPTRSAAPSFNQAATTAQRTRLPPLSTFRRLVAHTAAKYSNASNRTRPSRTRSPR